MIELTLKMPGKVQITVAKSAGFCPGVKNAIDKVLELAKSRQRTIYTLGPLIHNKQVIETLKEKNIFSVKSTDEIKEKKAILVIRAHGIPPEEEARIRALDLEVVDATCPLVKHVQENIRKHAQQGYSTIIVGDRDHAEVVGLMGYTEGRGFVVDGPEEVKRLPRLEKANIVAQTTQEGDVFLAAAAEARKIAGELAVSNTICNPTRQRQKETVEFSSKSDLVIVVGGKNSANTARLFQICERQARKAIHIEKEDELKAELFDGVSSVFITAGASTPSWMIEKVLEKAHELAEREENHLLESVTFAWKLFITASLYTAIGAAALTYVCMKLEGAPVSGELLLMAGLFAFSLHSANRAVEKGAAAPDRARKLLFGKYKAQSRFAAMISGALAIFLSAALGWKVFLTAAFFWFVGMMYPYKLPLGFDKIGRFTASKDIMTALGWAFMCAYAPGLWRGGALSNSTHLAVFFAFLLVFTRSVLFGISHAHSDMIVGNENFYKAAGPKMTYFTLFSIFLLLSAVLLTLKGTGWKPVLAAELLTGMMYYMALILLFFFGRIPERITAETLIDSQFIILALLAHNV
ncbi:MAG: 4-hydroxy-3-methylbut-2-enyl diphosphate reductase [Elusimicrobia bacterium]|nr:4-hydroxy-3-methylbut-2-enyl diphosphate reductase [Elusimicrobiota bacterium]